MWKDRMSSSYTHAHEFSALEIAAEQMRQKATMDPSKYLPVTQYTEL